MSTWMKKTITATGVTEYKPGPHLAKLSERFGPSGAVMLLLDVSGSMTSKANSTGKSTQTRLEAAIVGCSGFLEEAIGGGYKAGLVLWNHKIAASEQPSADGTAALTLLNQASPSGGTYLAPALEHAGQVLLDLAVEDRVIAVFSDGSLSDEDQSKRIASLLGNRGVRILTLGLGAASAQSLGMVSTESSNDPQTTSAATMSADIKSMARGLVRRKR